MANNWKKIWGGKGQSVIHNPLPTLEDLIREDGFDSGAGDHSIDSWRQLTSYTYSRLNINQGNRLLEVGCGCGAFLYDACQAGVTVSGIDLSEKLLEAARSVLPNGEFTRAEASEIPFEADTFDAVISHSVFQYFESEDYARQVILEMARVARSDTGRIAILDVNDEAKCDDFHRIRAGSIGAEAYRAKYQDYPHRFYRQAWFIDNLESAGFEVITEDQAIDGYLNSAFRFNVFASRRDC
ncbi:MAG: ubiquinone/menaquinone biosynthesis C-methylase UbiE [Halieaceae bacterium]|jgi:ubiquinone/menaquinone biosynthesis C-methylase UbiE